MNPYDHIEEYLANTLAEEDRLKMEESIKSDPELASVIHEYKTIERVAEGMLEADLLSMVERADSGWKPTSTKRRWWLIALIIILTILGILAVWHYTNAAKVNNDRLFAEYYQEPIWDIKRKANNTSMLSEAVEFYENGQISMAISTLESIDNTSKDYPKAQEYLAEMILAKDSPQRALAEIRQLPDSQRKDWLEVMVNIKLNKKETALIKLKEIIAANDHIYRDRAIRLFDEF